MVTLTFLLFDVNQSGLWTSSTTLYENWMADLYENPLPLGQRFQHSKTDGPTIL